MIFIFIAGKRVNCDFRTIVPGIDNDFVAFRRVQYHQAILNRNTLLFSIDNDVYRAFLKACPKPQLPAPLRKNMNKSGMIHCPLGTHKEGAFRSHLVHTKVRPVRWSVLKQADRTSIALNREFLDCGNEFETGLNGVSEISGRGEIKGYITTPLRAW